MHNIVAVYSVRILVTPEHTVSKLQWVFVAGESACAVLPLTPGTKIKMNQALFNSFSEFEKDRCRYNMPKG